MRDPKRIRPFLNKVAEYWEKVPDWRFGQLICNIPFTIDPFILEEDEFLKFLDKLFNEEKDEKENDEQSV